MPKIQWKMKKTIIAVILLAIIGILIFKAGILAAAAFSIVLYIGFSYKNHRQHQLQNKGAQTTTAAAPTTTQQPQTSRWQSWKDRSASLPFKWLGAAAAVALIIFYWPTIKTWHLHDDNQLVSSMSISYVPYHEQVVFESVGTKTITARKDGSPAVEFLPRLAGKKFYFQIASGKPGTCIRVQPVRRDKFQVCNDQCTELDTNELQFWSYDEPVDVRVVVYDPKDKKHEVCATEASA